MARLQSPERRDPRVPARWIGGRCPRSQESSFGRAREGRQGGEVTLNSRAPPSAGRAYSSSKTRRRPAGRVGGLGGGRRRAGAHGEGGGRIFPEPRLGDLAG